MQLGRYRLEEQVGQGGMAVVWRGFDTQLKRVVAVKVLHAHLHSREEVRRRFDREAQAVARLHHPHILDVYDFSGLEVQPSYLVTEFIRGTTLRHFADAHPFDPPELAAACLLPIAEALEHAHANQVVHRDLKPENVMVREDGVIKLTDFGIAALLNPDEKFTVTGSILGSPGHLAPETIEGKPTDPRSDLYSFGTVLYWLSCGQLPYQANSPAALLHLILAGKRIDPRLVRPSVSDEQAKVIARCMETDPAKRYQSATELKKDLVELLAHAGIDEPVRELTAFVQGAPPEAEGARVRARLVARCLARGEEQLGLGKTSAALAAFGRALALEPGNAPARGRVERIRRRALLYRRARQAVVLLGACALVTLGGHRVYAAVQRTRADEAAFARADEEARTAAVIAAAAAIPPAGPAPVSPQPPGANPASPAGSNSASSSSANRPPASRAAPLAPVRSSVPATHHPARPTVVAQVEPPSPRTRPAANPELLEVILHPRFPSEVSLDGRELPGGRKQAFALAVTPGLHHLIVKHPCCSDHAQDVFVNPNKTDQIYQLETGMPKAARIVVANAPPGTRVLVNGDYLGTVPDLPPVAMGEQPTREVELILGNRILHSVRLEAGRDKPVDYESAAP